MTETSTTTAFVDSSSPICLLLVGGGLSVPWPNIPSIRSAGALLLVGRCIDYSVMKRLESIDFDVGLPYVPAPISRLFTWCTLKRTKSDKSSTTSFGHQVTDLFKRFPESLLLPKVGEVPTDVLLFCGSVLIGSLYVYCRAGGRKGHGDRQTFAAAREVARQHSWKQRNGFKDKSLYEFIDACVKRRKTLRKVEDPRNARRAKIEAIKLADKSKPKGPLGLSPDRLQIERRRLQNVTNKPPDFAGGNA